MDNYQAVYDAVRSKISNGDIGAAVRDAISQADLSFALMQVRDEVNFAISKATAPHVLMRPEVHIDGNQYCLLYGKNLMEGIAGFGSTMAEAAQNFDENWLNSKAPQPKTA